MMLGLTMIISFLLIAVLLILLPLGLSNKGKLLTLSVCVLLGLMGYVGTNVFPLWQIVLIQISLAFLLSYIFDKRLQDSLYVQNDEDEEYHAVRDIPKPLYSMYELEEKAKGFETVDRYYSTVLVPSSEEKDTIKEPESVMENTLNLEKESPPEEEIESKGNELIEEQAEEFPELESDFIIPLQIHQEINFDLPSHIPEMDDDELPISSGKEIEMDEIDFDGVDDAEALMMSRMRSFNREEPAHSASERMGINEDSIEEIELPHRVKSPIEESNQSQELFDDLEELYKSRKQT